MSHRITKLFFLLSLTGIFFTLIGCTNNKPKDSFRTLESKFINPPAEYRSKPLWVWNGKVTESELDRMLIELKESGFGGLFVHPRPGMITEYLSDDWHAMYKYTIDKGKEMGLEVWIYDENSYPSGFAGGHVPQEMPESYNQGQGLACDKIEILLEDTEKYYLILKKEKDTWTDITATSDEYKNTQGEYYCYYKTYYSKSDWHGGYSYVDLLVPGVTEKFIEITMAGYEKTFKNEFGKTVPGIFTDEPNIVTSGGLRWTPDLFDVFQAKWGYDLKTVLPLLNEEMGEWKTVRHNYQETLLQLFIDRWSKPWNAYCEANNLKWTGHYWEHGWPHMNDGPDNMAMYAWHQIPAIDMLFNQFNEESPTAQFGNIRAVKELRSAANQMGCARTLSETYGGGGWEETFKDFKRLGDWEYVLGVNFMNQHLSHMTLTGARKYDYPPVFTYHSPWWNNYKELNDYFARLSVAMSMGVQQNDILVLEPTSTLWSYYSHTSQHPSLMKIGENFQAFVTTLEKSQVEYDLGSENIIKDHGSVKNGKFIVGKAAYSTVVLPPYMENLNAPTFALLRQFVAEGGQIIAFSSPELIDGTVNSELSALMAESSVIKLLELSADVIQQYLLNDDFSIQFVDGNLYHHRRQFADGELVFIVNSSMEEASVGAVKMKGETLLQMNALNGKITVYPATQENGFMSAEFKVEPAGSLLLFCSEKAKNNYDTTPFFDSEVVPSVGETFITRLQDNAIMIDFVDVTVKGQTHKNLHFSNAADIAFRAHDFANGNPWNTSVQYKQNILDRGNYTDGGFTAVYYFPVNGNFDYSGMKLVSERPEIFTVKINGQPLTAIPNQWWLDKSFGVYAIGGHVKKGMNTVELSVNPMNIFAEIEPIYIIGDFAVVPERVGWSISAPTGKNLTFGSWKEQQLPFYSWGVKYSQTYNLDVLSESYCVELGKWTGTVSEVYVNGEKAGWIGFDPYRLDITSFLKEGENRIDVVVIGSLKNLLGPHYRNPDSGLVTPWHWKGVNQKIPGLEYQMIDYGLMEEFRLLHQ